MVTERDLRRLAAALPETTVSDDSLAITVLNKGKAKGIAWSWKERVDPKKARVENRRVLAVRVDGETAKQALLSADPRKYFTEPHYNGYPAILVRLDAIGKAELAALLTDAWRLQAPRALVAAHDGTPARRRRSPRRV